MVLKGKTVFISDLHLGLFSRAEEEKREEVIVNFLYSLDRGVDALYILGDLFDYWFEYRRVIQKGYFRLFTALKHLTDKGVKVYYIIGNHDFFHRDFFESYLGVKVEPDIIATEIDGKKFFLGHGDGLIKNDYGYKVLKKIFRNRFIQWLYSLIHPDLGIMIASGTSKQSREYTTGKDYGETDALFETARTKIDSGYDYVLFGHSHVKTVREYKHGKYINLGTWLAELTYGVFENNKFEILNWEDNGEKQ
ncbi:MAG: UDP-2,3-diacylglucosamine hydrolase [Melioribacteraceae bacterium]|nr:MAG: UDP-2,3-diacylglucosamine hydrolase [Melioribacteraceae bacterium]